MILGLYKKMVELKWSGWRDSNSQHSDSKSFRVGKQGKTATNKDNNINIIKALHYCHISPNVACFCKLMAQNLEQKFTLVRACIGFFVRWLLLYSL